MYRILRRNGVEIYLLLLENGEENEICLNSKRGPTRVRHLTPFDLWAIYRSPGRNADTSLWLTLCTP